MGVFVRYFEVKPLRYQGIVFWVWLQVPFTSKRSSRIHSILTHQPIIVVLREHKVYAEPQNELFNSLRVSGVGAYSQTYQ